MSTTEERRCKYCGRPESEWEWICPATLTAAHEPEPPTPEPAPYQPLTIEWWIERVDRVVQEAPQMGTEPILSKAAVMAQLYTVQALQSIAASLERIATIIIDADKRDRI